MSSVNNDFKTIYTFTLDNATRISLINFLSSVQADQIVYRNPLEAALPTKKADFTITVDGTKYNKTFFPKPKQDRISIEIVFIPLGERKTIGEDEKFYPNSFTVSPASYNDGIRIIIPFGCKRHRLFIDCLEAKNGGMLEYLTGHDWKFV